MLHSLNPVVSSILEFLVPGHVPQSHTLPVSSCTVRGTCHTGHATSMQNCCVQLNGPSRAVKVATTCTHRRKLRECSPLVNKLLVGGPPGYTSLWWGKPPFFFLETVSRLKIFIGNISQRNLVLSELNLVWRDPDGESCWYNQRIHLTQTRRVGRWNNLCWTLRFRRHQPIPTQKDSKQIPPAEQEILLQ